MKKFLLTSTLLFTSLSCMKDQRREMINKQKRELNIAQNKIADLITAFIKTDIIVQSEKLVRSAKVILNAKNSKLSPEKKGQLKQATESLSYLKKNLENRIENAKEDLEFSKDPNNGLKLLGSIYVIAKHEKIQNKIVKTLDEIAENIEIILEINKEKQFIANSEMLGFQKLITKCKILIKELSPVDKKKNENEIKISFWISQTKQFSVLRNNKDIRIEENVRSTMKEIITEAEIAIKEKNLVKLDELKEKRALPIVKEIYNDYIRRSELLDEKEKLIEAEKEVLIELGKNLENPECIMIGKTRSIAYEYLKIQTWITEAKLEDEEEWKIFSNKYSFSLEALKNFLLPNEAKNLKNNFENAFEKDFGSSFTSLENRVNETKNIKLRKNLLKVLNYLKIKLDDMKKKLMEEKK